MWIIYSSYDGKEGYCDYKSCDNTFDKTACMNNGLNCTWGNYNPCIEPFCYDFNTEDDCVKSDLNCEWEEDPYCYSNDQDWY